MNYYCCVIVLLRTTYHHKQNHQHSIDTQCYNYKYMIQYYCDNCAHTCLYLQHTHQYLWNNSIINVIKSVLLS